MTQKQTTQLIAVLFISASIIFFGCKKKEDTTLGDPDLATPVLKSIYICGYEINESGRNVAKYWKDEVEFVLSSGGTDAQAQALWIDGTDVHCVGNRKTGTNSSSLPVRWKNGNEVPLSTVAMPFSNATDIFIDGSDIYIVGYERNADGVNVAKLWINDEVTNLSDGITQAKALAVFVDDGNVHVVGTQNNSEFDNTPVAIHWLNGVPDELTNAETDALAFDVAVSNGNVYICGEVVANDGTDESSNKMLWINGVAQYTPIVGEGSSAYGMAKVGSDVYMAGYDASTGCQSGYWKNGGFTVLCPDMSFNQNEQKCWKIAVDNNDVYVTGTRGHSGGSSLVGQYWKNGVAHTLGSTPYQEGLYDIVIK